MRKPKETLSLAAIVGIPLVVAAVTVPLLTVPQPARAADPPGKAAFLAQKCNMCHSIDSQGVARTGKSEKMAGPDLSNVGAEHDAAWMTAYLKKEQANAEGKKHGKGWAGSDEDLAALTEWLASLKKG